MSRFNFRITMGIPKPEKEPTSIDEMRVAIDKAGWDSALINRCLATAQHRGASGEDKYAMLAYYALRELERLWKLQQRWEACQLRPLVMPEGTLKP